MTNPHRFTPAAVLLAAAALVCAVPAAAQVQTRIGPLYPRPTAGPVVFPRDSAGLRFRLDQVVGSSGVQARPARTTGRLLTVDEQQRLLGRLAPLRILESAADSFNFPAETLRPPRAGRVIADVFPARDTSAVGRPVPSGAAAAAPLTLLRRAPEGEVDEGAEVTITFSQPMVPLGSVSSVAAQAVPVRMTPAAPGRWRWIDARTLKFEPAGRLPMATVYTVEVPAGTRGTSGAPLAEPIRWSFSTPAPRALGARPQGSPTRLTPVMAVVFDQRVDPAAVLRTVRVRVGGTVLPVRLATAAEIDAQGDNLRGTLASYPAGRAVAFRTVASLPRGATVRVSVGPGTPSAEGPRTTTVDQFWEFETYGPLRITNKYCSCRPGEGFYVTFSNQLDERTFSERMVTVEPAVPGFRAWAGGNGIRIDGDTRPQTHYTVRIDPALRDEFGQTLGAAPPQGFDVGLPYAVLNGPGEMVVLDPLGEPLVSLGTTGHRRLRLRVQRVEAADWKAFKAVERPDGGGPARLPGRAVVDRVITVDPADGQELRVDVAPALAGGLGHALVAVEALDGGSEDERAQASYTWVQATRIGVSAYSDADDLLAWATSLVDGAPVAGAEVQLIGGGGPVRQATDARGVATLAFASDTADAELLVVRSGADVALLPPGYAGWRRVNRLPTALWYAFTDRNLYKPGEQVRFKGWVRRLEQAPAAVPALLRPGTQDSVRWTAYDARRNRIAEGASPLGALGGFDAAFTVPAGANLGGSTIEVRLGRPDLLSGEQFSFAYQVQEFRRPEYTVTAAASDGPHYLGGSAEVTVHAAYFAGGALAAAPVHWNVTATDGWFTPPGWDEWSFGDAQGWWRPAYRPGGTARTQTLDGATNAAGENVLRISFSSADPPRPYTVTAEATVTDVNRQTWSASSSMLVHPSAVYVGVRSERGWLSVGDSIDLDLVAVDVDGAPVPGRTIDVTAKRTVWRQVQGTWQQTTENLATCSRASEPQPVRCVFPVPVAGRYEATATARDAQGRVNQTVAVFWVTDPRGGYSFGPEMEGDGERGVELIPDRKTYAVGDTARVLVRTQFQPSVGLLTTRVNGIARVEQVRLGGATTTLTVPITEAEVPNVNLQLDLVGASDGRHGEGARGVLYATGAVSLPVPPATRTLSVKPLPRDSVSAPDAQTEVGIEVRDAAGRPVANAEVALVVVDEAVLALTGYTVPNPLASFYRDRDAGVQDLNLRQRVLVSEPDYAPEPHTLVGRVVDARNRGYLGGARLLLDGGRDTLRADEAGRFRITGVAAGTHTLLVLMEGYAAARVSVTVTGDQAPAPLRVALVPTALRRMAAREVMANGMAAVAQDQASFAAPAAAKGFQELVPPAPPPPPPPPAPGGQAPGPQIAIRANFDPLAVFAPVVRTDANGRAMVPFKLPSNLTRYRVTAVAVEGGTRYGLGESAITARQPLMIRPSAPRFLNWGDRFELPVVVQNQTGAPLEVDVAARGTGVNVTETGWRVTVPAHDRVEVRLAAEAAQAGTARLQVATAVGDLADAAEITLPVYTPATTEAFATYGTFTGDSAVTLPLQVPADAIPSFGGLEVSASSTALHELTDALLYLVRYPYECAEQISSRMLGVTALRDVLYAFKANELPPPDSLRASVDRDIRDLVARQNEDGGFGFWRRGQPSFPYVSIHAAHALQRAREKGYTVPDGAYALAGAYLRRVPGNLPREYPPDVKRALHAYALYVRARMGDTRAPAEVRRWVETTPRDSVTVEEAGWLLSAAGGDAETAGVRAELLRIINNRATETPSTATFATSYTEGEYLLLHSNRRTDGVVLEALVAAQPDNPLVPKVVRGLLGHRVQGRWDNTQENAWVLIALDRYFHAFEGQTPEFVARLWLGERYAGSHAFSGRQADRSQVSAPMRVLQEQRPADITIGKEGPGRLYYRAGLRYAPRDLDLLPLDAGFVVSRTYEAVDDAGDVALGADGQWRVKAGARVRVTVTMTAPSRRLHVALVDPLPAGFEPVNPELQGSQESPPSTASRTTEWGWWWRAYWYQHQNLRDQRAEAFTSLLPAGTYTYQYVARATTPGRFIVPPPHAEEMYSPEVFGRGKTERVNVVPAEER